MRMVKLRRLMASGGSGQRPREETERAEDGGEVEPGQTEDDNEVSPDGQGRWRGVAVRVRTAARRRRRPPADGPRHA